MTGVVFMHILKHKEIEHVRIQSRKGKKGGNNAGANANPGNSAK